MKKKKRDDIRMTLLEFVVLRYRSVGEAVKLAGMDEFWDALKWVNYNLPNDVPALDPAEFAHVLREYAECVRRGRILKALGGTGLR